MKIKYKFHDIQTKNIFAYLTKCNVLIVATFSNIMASGKINFLKLYTCLHFLYVKIEQPNIVIHE